MSSKIIGRATVRFAQVLWLAALAAMLCSPAMAQDTSQSRFGVNVHLPYKEIDWANLERVAEAGIGWIRVDFSWDTVEPTQGDFNWTKYDDIVAHAEALGLNVFASVLNPPTWALEDPSADKGDPGYNVIGDLSAWNGFVDQAVRRYAGQIDHWGIWNEPDLSWYGTRDGFIDDVFIPAADTIHAASDTAKVVGPGTSMLGGGGDPEPWYDWVADFFIKAGDKFDIFDCHVYRNNRGEMNLRLEWDGDISGLLGQPPGTTITTSASIKANLDVYGWDGPVWLTETGWQYHSDDPCFQAQRLTETLEDWFTGDPNRDWIDKMFVYHLWDGPTFIDGGKGILNPDGTPRESFIAYADFIADHPIPEPATVSLLAAAGVGGLLRGRRRRRSVSGTVP